MMTLVLKSVLAALFLKLSFSMTEHNFATSPEHGATHGWLQESQSGSQPPLNLGIHYISR